MSTNGKDCSLYMSLMQICMCCCSHRIGWVRCDPLVQSPPPVYRSFALSNQSHSPGLTTAAWSSNPVWIVRAVTLHYTYVIHLLLWKVGNIITGCKSAKTPHHRVRNQQAGSHAATCLWGFPAIIQTHGISLMWDLKLQSGSTSLWCSVHHMFVVQSGTATVHGADSVQPLPTLHSATQLLCLKLWISEIHGSNVDIQHTPRTGEGIYFCKPLFSLVVSSLFTHWHWLICYQA